MKGLFIEFWAGLGKAAKNTTVSRASSGEAADGHLPCLSICSCTPPLEAGGQEQHEG